MKYQLTIIDDPMQATYETNRCKRTVENTMRRYSGVSITGKIVVRRCFSAPCVTTMGQPVA